MYSFVAYRLDLVLLCLFAAAGLVTSNLALRRRRSTASLPGVAKLVAVLVVIIGALIGEFWIRGEHKALTSAFAGFAPTYAYEMQKIGHARVNFATSPDDPTYLALIDAEKSWLQRNPLIADIYTVRRDNQGRPRFVVDSETDYDHDGKFEGAREQRTPIGELFPDPTPTLSEAFAGRTVFDPTIASDRWGVWVSSHAPIYDAEGRVEAVVGVDFPAADWLRAIAVRRIMVTVIVLFLMGLLLWSATLITLMRTELVERAAAQKELQEAKEAALLAGRAKSEFLAVMSHEIRTPLTAITGYASMLEDSPLDALQQRYVRTMRQGAENLVSLLNNILDYSKIEEGKLQLDTAPCAPADIARDVIDLLSGTAREKKITLRFEDRLERTLWVSSDHARLRQIVMNLVGNAVKFTAKGSVTVILSWTPTPAIPDEGTLEVTVADTGPGISAARLPKLFQMFAQGDSGTARRYGGSGMGLAICRSLVEMMKGKISARSVVDVGTEFTFTIPCRRVDAPAPEDPAVAAFIVPAVTPPSPEAVTPPVTHPATHPQATAATIISAPPAPLPPPGGDRLLVVDDNVINCDVIKAMLVRAGYRIDIAQSGPDAIVLASRERYAAILMDVAMPGMDGLTAAKMIRGSELEYRTPIIAVTAATGKSDRDACHEAGMDDFITKPIDRKLLLAAISRLCGSRPPFPPKSPPTVA